MEHRVRKQLGFVSFVPTAIRCSHIQARVTPAIRWLGVDGSRPMHWVHGGAILEGRQVERKGMEDCGHWRQSSQAIDSEPHPQNPAPFPFCGGRLSRAHLRLNPPYPKPNELPPSHPLLVHATDLWVPLSLTPPVCDSMMLFSVAEAAPEHQLLFGTPSASEWPGPGS